ncbi:hypothetical protein [Hymenobacter terrenus]|uniref:hypothetical protein n=1 Tax=Hymenobacter terrenus TaxID=1629124 RepID=UPI0012E025B6|nr:hypothetical protein [Hymenobacter terrenus]
MAKRRVLPECLITETKFDTSKLTTALLRWSKQGRFNKKSNYLKQLQFELST